MDSISPKPDYPEPASRVMSKLLPAAILIAGVTGLGIMGGLIYIAVHFIAKVW